MLQGYTLKGIFKVNTHAVDGQYDALTQGLVGQPNGQEGFELHYHEINNPIAAKPNEGDSGVDVLKGDYEILKYQSGDTIIPTNESEGLYPRGNTLPDLSCNMVVLFNIVMGEHETKLAQEELAARTIKEIKRRAQDNNNYSFSSNAVVFANKNPKLYIGQKVTFDDGFGYQLKTRVLRLVTKLDYPIIQEITVGNQAVKGTISQLKEDVNNILSGNFSGSGLNSTQTSELIKNYVDPRFLRKNIPDTAQEVITFLKGIEFGDDFVKDGSGAGVYKDDNGQWHIDTDYLHARKKLTAEEVEVMKTSHIKGKVVNSAGGFVISRIEKIAGAWRCYFVQQDSEGRRVYNSMRKDDLALCETFNLIDNNGQTANHYWHRRVTDVGTDYVDIADNTNVDDYASGSDAPQVGDEVVQLGNLTVSERQSAIIQSAAGENSPYFKIIKGINSFTLPDPIFLFDKQKFEIRVENPANRGKYIRLQDFLETMQGRINAVQQQSDKQLVIWFGDAVPSITTDPANEWTDETTKELHEHDIYYNRSYVETGGGRAYSFERNPDGSFSWHEITDADVLKSLEAAKHAQDTADGKRRMFVREHPVPPYDKGDQWSNATFGDKYHNDLLVCVRPKAAGEEFSIEDWQAAQEFTSNKFKAEMKTTADKITATVTNLKNGLVEVGFELDGEKKSFTVTAENFKVQTPSGKVALMTSDGKVNADLIEAKSIRTSPSSDGLHINMYEGTFDVLTKDNKKGISMTVDKDGFPHLIFFDNEGNAKYDLGYTGLKELVSAYQAAYWTKQSLVNVTDKGLSAVYPKTVKGKVWHDYHAARHYATGKLGDDADNDGKTFDSEDVGYPIPDGWYTAENEQGQYLERGNESIVDEENQNKPKIRVFGVAISKAENGRLSNMGHVWFSVTNNRASFCDPDGKPLAVTESLLQNYPFDQYKDRV